MRIQRAAEGGNAVPAVKGNGLRRASRTEVCETERVLRYQTLHMKYAMRGYENINQGGTAGKNLLSL